MNMNAALGTVVISSAGHDSGHWFVVTGADGNHLLISDGKERKLCAPKKKNTKHVRLTKHSIVLEGLTDKRLRQALNALKAASIAEESE